MHQRTLMAAALVAIVMLSAGAHAGEFRWSVPAAPADGGLTAYSYGGAGDIVGNGVSMADAMNDAAGSGHFNDSRANIFLVDFAGSSLSDAGLSLFVMFGTGAPRHFLAQGQWDPNGDILQRGHNNDPYSQENVPDTFGSDAQVWGVGENVFIGNNSFTVDYGNFGGPNTPVGLAISNFDTIDDFDLDLLLPLVDDIKQFAIFSRGLGLVFESGSSDQGGHVDLFQVIPLPQAFWIGGIGLGIVAVGRVRRKLRS